MDHYEHTYGKITLNINDLIKESGYSKGKICKLTNIKRSQFNKYCQNKITRMDFLTISKLCWVFQCTPNQLFTYEPPIKNEV